MSGRERDASAEPDSSRTASVPALRVVAALLLVYAVGTAAALLGGRLPAVVRVPLVVAALTVVPGGLAVLALLRDPALDAMHALYAVGLSLLLLMAVGVVANVTLPALGVERPIAVVPLAGSVTLAVGALAGAAVALRRRDAVRVRVPRLLAPVPLAFLTLPFVSVLAVTRVNETGDSGPLLVLLVVVALVPLAAVRWVPREWYALGVWTTSLAILYHKSLWQFSGFGGRPHGVRVWEAGRWTPGLVELGPYTSELLPNGLLFPMYARLADVFILTQYEVVNPLFVSVLPVAIFVAVRHYVDGDVAFLSAAMFAFAHPFYLQYPTVGRAAAPVIFLALFAVALAESEHSPGTRAVLALLFLSGVVVSHYGTSYYVMFAFVLALGLLVVFEQVEERVTPALASLRDRESALEVPRAAVGARSLSIFSWSMVLFYAAATLAWYLYARGGWKFDLLPKHVATNLHQLLAGPTVSGRTAARIQKSYGTPSIHLSKQVYTVLGLLIVVGFLVVLYRRFVEREAVVDDRYLAVAGSLFVIFVSTVVLRNWGGGRPMMITFVFTVVFAALGTVWLGNRTLGRGGKEAFAAVLAVLFVLNTGVAAAVVLGGYAPSNVPLQSQLANGDSPHSQMTVHRDTDIATHVWVVEHRGVDDVYADTFGARQFDWYRPAVAAYTPAVESGYGQAHPKAFTPRDGGLKPGYVLVLGHNEALESVWPVRFEPGVPLDDLRLSARHRVYANGEASVYFSTTATNTTACADCETAAQR
jgi:uncharacterized membrane protein